MILDFGHIWHSMSPLNKVIFFVLMGMAIISVAVTVERMLAFARSARESRLFARNVAPLIQAWRVEEIVELGAKHKGSNLARLFAAIAKRYIDAVDDDGGVSPVMLARNEAERRKEQIGSELRRGFSALATVGSIAPFVGLLGTVVGIIAAFQGIGTAGGGGMSSVMNGIAEALIETALGLMVAIPAVVMFNYLTARVTTIDIALGRSAGELLDEVDNNHGRGAAKRTSEQVAA
jgi:biopolymer transport protein ExbB